jgi:hypothetical protein
MVIRILVVTEIGLGHEANLDFPPMLNISISFKLSIEEKRSVEVMFLDQLYTYEKAYEHRMVELNSYNHRMHMEYLRTQNPKESSRIIKFLNFKRFFRSG